MLTLEIRSIKTYNQVFVNLIFLVILLKRSESESGSSDCQTEKKAKREDIHPDEPNVEEQLDAARAEIRQLKAQVEALKLHKFGLERFSRDNDSIKFYTGFVSYQHLVTFYEIVKPSAESMQYCYTSSMSSNARPDGRTMVLIDELFLFLLRIRLGLLQQDLAHRFNVHESTVSRKVITWANYLYFFLGAQPIWPSKEAVQKHLPQEFRVLYPNTRVVIDFTEIRVQVPSSLLLQSQMYSSYKSGTTLKSLIGITPHGAVSFVSALYTGSISDKEITRCCGILDLLEPNDSAMADKGFNIGDMLTSRKVSLNLPPYLSSGGQFSSKEVKETKTIAKLRIHVERAIRRIKEHHIYDTPSPLSLLGTVNQLWTVTCLLVNFQGPLILKSNSS